MIELNEEQIRYVKGNFNVNTVEPEKIEFLENEDFIEYLIGVHCRMDGVYMGEGLTFEECIFQSILVRCNIWSFVNVLKYIDHFTTACIDSEYYELAQNLKELKLVIVNKTNDYQHYLLNN